MLWVGFEFICLVISSIFSGNQGVSAGSDLTGAIF